MTRDQDLRLKLTRETHAVLSQLASMDRLTMQAYVERLISDHCNSRLDVAKQLLAAVESLRADAPTKRDQLLYFVQKGGAAGPVKIGVAASVSARIKGLQTGSDEPLALLHSMPQSDAINERGLHRMFRALRQEGEWFAPDVTLMEFIADLKKTASGKGS